VQYPLLMAGSVISILPMLIIFVVAQRFFVRGIALTGLGGR
jgi:multiple sugar transport system permease protein